MFNGSGQSCESFQHVMFLCFLLFRAPFVGETIGFCIFHPPLQPMGCSQSMPGSDHVVPSGPETQKPNAATPTPAKGNDKTVSPEEKLPNQVSSPSTMKEGEERKKDEFPEFKSEFPDNTLVLDHEEMVNIGVQVFKKVLSLILVGFLSWLSNNCFGCAIAKGGCDEGV